MADTGPRDDGTGMRRVNDGVFRRDDADRVERTGIVRNGGADDTFYAERGVGLGVRISMDSSISTEMSPFAAKA